MTRGAEREALNLLADARKCVEMVNGGSGYYDNWLARCDRVIALAKAEAVASPAPTPAVAEAPKAEARTPACCDEPRLDTKDGRCICGAVWPTDEAWMDNAFAVADRIISVLGLSGRDDDLRCIASIVSRYSASGAEAREATPRVPCSQHHPMPCSCALPRAKRVTPPRRGGKGKR